MRSGFISGVGLSLCCCLLGCATDIPPATAADGEERAGFVSLPGLQYKVLLSGPTSGARPRRSDDVMIRYVGRLTDGSIFSTSSAEGTEPSRFSVRTVIPGFSALVQLMRPGDRWRFVIPAYLGYGHEGRVFTPPEATLKRGIPPGSTLIFDVDLVKIVPGG